MAAPAATFPRRLHRWRPPIPRAHPRHADADAARLRPLLHSAATLDLLDRDGWARLRDAARPAVGVLVAGGRLPAHLTVSPDDSPMVVTRTLLAAWQRVTDAG